ncbi:MAG: D-alanyl-D-alanine carboxypeptidase [Sediminimonas qiaohouensis]|uniref:D-alanyl-D-alanine carboxypeptidase n=1 Tax=Sediminimonas qiaohouensis TaxID=552061 RepID=A0A7C9LQV5_9RHOB|nr:D-alanyl-D-alanine carboxypeptidase family protein [Sediminimonas qiaohouensis]MTJ03756.1 D-alanyl-D-alanine carboxypeptidase [Sediminimonas qiaohouensis]
MILAAAWLLVAMVGTGIAAPYAAMVMDARTGKVLHSRNADTRLHPASLTKMMTLYIVFEAVEHGEIGLDDMVRISRNAASEPPSKLGLRAGQRIKLRYLIRAAAVKSANDAATALGEAIEGTEAAFARRMNRTAKALGMTRTTFKNMHGLTESGHLSTARDMTILGRHVIYDYPQYYNLFSRKTADAGVRRVRHTNRRLLSDYSGADGIKTGYTRAAGFNLVASAHRGRERVIATVFGGRSTATRNARVAELLDMGFSRAPTQVALRKPQKPAYHGSSRRAGKTIRIVTTLHRSLRPRLRPAPATPQVASAAIKDGVTEALAEIQATPDLPDDIVAPRARPANLTISPEEEAVIVAAASSLPQPGESEPEAEGDRDPEREVVTRISTSGGHDWGINLGRYNTRHEAQGVLLKTALREMSTLEGSLRKVVPRGGGYDAQFMGLDRDSADVACRRLQARQITCFMMAPG